MYILIVNYRPHNSVADGVKPGHPLLACGDRHALLTAATGNSQNDRPKYTWCHTMHEINCIITMTSLLIVVNNNSHLLSECVTYNTDSKSC